MPLNYEDGVGLLTNGHIPVYTQRAQRHYHLAKSLISILAVSPLAQPQTRFVA